MNANPLPRVTAAESGNRRALGSGAALAAGAQTTTAVALGLTTVIVARLLGPEGTGAYGVIASGVVMLITITALGLGVGITYSVSHGRWPAGDALRQSQLAAVAIGLPAIAVGVGLAVLLNDSVLRQVPVSTTLIAVSALPFALSWTYSWSVALGADRYGWYALAYGGHAVLTLVLVGGLTVPFGLQGAVAGLASAYVIASIAQAAIGSQRLAATGGLLLSLGARMRTAVSFGLRAYLSNSVSYLALRADLFILSAYAAPASVGRYAIALALTELVMLLPRSLSAVVLPRVAALDASAEAEHQRIVVIKSIRHTFVVALGAAALLAMASPLIPLVYGSAFTETILLTLLLIPGAAALGVSASFSAVIAGKGKPEYSLYAALMATVPSIGLYLIVIPEYGAHGAAIASTCSYTALTFAALMFFRHVTGIRTVTGLLPRPDDLADYRPLASSLIRYARYRGRPSDRS